MKISNEILREVRESPTLSEAFHASPAKGKMPLSDGQLTHCLQLSWKQAHPWLIH